MARLQIMWLPPVENADGSRTTPFALVVDQCEMDRPFPKLTVEPPIALHPSGTAQTVTDSPAVQVTEGESEQDRWQRFAEQIGARGALVTPERVDIAGEKSTDNLLVEFDTAALSESFAAALRAHLESPEASDAVRAYYERGAARARSER